MTHPKPTAATVKPATSKPTSSVPDKTASEKAPAAGTAGPTKVRLAFSLMLTVAAVLPVAMGVGAVRLRASASSEQRIATTAEQNREAKDAAQAIAASDRRQGDELFVNRRYEVALRHFQSLGSGDENRLPSELLYRIALCEEALGRWNEAVEHLRSVSQTASQPVLKAAALFGLARVWLRSNEPAKAASLLRYLVLQSEIQSAIPANMSREIAFLIPLALAKSTTAQVRFADRTDETHTSLFCDESLEMALGWVDRLARDVASEADADSPANACDIRWKVPAPDMIGSMPIESQIVQVCCRHQTLKAIVERIADQRGWIVDWSDLAQDPSLDRVVSMTMEGHPLCLILTIICSELHATWTVTDDRLIVSRSRLNGEDARGMIAQSLMSLTKWIPKNQYVDEARFALAEIAQSECCLLEAAKLFAALAASNSSPLAIRAAANSADNFYRIHDYPSACTQLKHVVDGAPVSQLHAESLVLLGRLQLDLGDTQEAIFELRRATDGNNSHVVQAKASILLGLAYLLQNKFQEAAEAVFLRKFQFEEPELRNAAAFVTSFARWHCTNGETRERESSYLFRSLISINPDLESLGQTGRLLIGRGYQELGFGEKMAEIYSKMLSTEVTENIRDEVTFSLANYEMESDQPESAKQKWWQLSNGRSQRLASRSRLRLAAMALIEDRPRDCLEICELIRSDDEISNADIQRLMGHAFEQLGEDTLAARCYAGQYKVP